MFSPEFFIYKFYCVSYFSNELTTAEVRDLEVDRVMFPLHNDQFLNLPLLSDGCNAWRMIEDMRDELTGANDVESTVSEIYECEY